jgi:hypothetical protein
VRQVIVIGVRRPTLPGSACADRGSGAADGSDAPRDLAGPGRSLLRPQAVPASGERRRTQGSCTSGSGKAVVGDPWTVPPHRKRVNRRVLQRIARRVPWRRFPSEAGQRSVVAQPSGVYSTRSPPPICGLSRTRGSLRRPPPVPARPCSPAGTSDWSALQGSVRVRPRAPAYVGAWAGPIRAASAFSSGTVRCVSAARTVGGGRSRSRTTYCLQGRAGMGIRPVRAGGAHGHAFMQLARDVRVMLAVTPERS